MGVGDFIRKLASKREARPVKPRDESSASLPVPEQSSRGDIKRPEHRPGRAETSKEVTSRAARSDRDELRVKPLEGKVVVLRDIAFARGRSWEVWRGQWERGGGVEGSEEEVGEEVVDGEEISGEEEGVEKVALKTYLWSSRMPKEAYRRLAHEVPKWAELSHPNVQPFYGITIIEKRLYMVSPWHENGDLLAYVKKNPAVNKEYLLAGSAAGLAYIHSMGTVHGRVKCKNVLISNGGEPLISDVGIATISGNMDEIQLSKTTSPGDVVRYIAPEVLENKDASPTKKSDTFSFGMLIVECITEEVPFSDISNPLMVINARTRKKQLPSRPKEVSDGLWDLMVECWSANPGDRLTMEDVHNFFSPPDPNAQ